MDNLNTGKLRWLPALRFPSSKKAFSLLSLSSVNTIIQFINFTLLSKYLSVEGFGYYRTFLSITSFSGLFHLGYADGLAIKWIVDKKTPKTADLFILLLINCITATALIFYPTKVTNFYILAMFMVVSNLLVFVWNMFIKNNTYIMQAACLFASQLMLMAYCSFAKTTINVQTIIVYTLSCNMVFAGVLYLMAWRKRMLRLDLGTAIANADEAKKDIKIGFPILLMGLFFLSLFNLDKIILPPFYNKVDFGYYAFASSIIGVIITILLSPSNLVFNKMAPLSDDMLASFHQRIYLLLAAVNTFLILALPLLFLLIERYMPKFKDSSHYIVGYCFCVFPVLVLQLLTNNMYRVKKLTPIFLRISLFFLGALAIFYFTSHYHIRSLQYMPFYIAQMLLLFLLINEVLVLKINSLLKKGLLTRLLIIAALNTGLILTYLKFKTS